MLRTIVPLALLVATMLVGCAAPPTATAPVAATPAAAEQDLASFLGERGYVRVPMSRIPTGHFTIAGMADTTQLRVILDTGASHTVLDRRRAERFDLETTEREGRAAGLGTADQAVGTGALANVRFGPVHFETMPVAVLDLSHVNQALAMLGVEPIDGIVGADVLLGGDAVIDYATQSLYLRRE
jgi:predicted aspartyl protease